MERDFKDVARDALWDDKSMYDATCSDELVSIARAYVRGAEWALAGMAVCEFLSDLAALVNRCPKCEGTGATGWCRCSSDCGHRCPACRGDGKRVAP